MHRLHDARHLGWDKRLPPAFTVAPGDTLEIAVTDCFDGQLGRDANAADIAALDFSRANPLSGPICVDGAQPGDALAVDILGVDVAQDGWTAVIPGFGLLADDFGDPHVVVSACVDNQVAFGDVAQLWRHPFVGTIGVAPADDGVHSVIPPRRVGGNMDCRDVRPGARLLLPIEVEGAMLSVGDTHAAQGDGEVCGTAVEVAATVQLRVDVIHGSSLAAPRIELPHTRIKSGVVDAVRRDVTLGIGPDLAQASRDATRAMVSLLVDRDGLAPADAYALCSVAGDLRIAEIVDEPNWVVAMELAT